MTIDTCYEGVIQKLTSQGKIIPVSLKLGSLDSNDKRTLYVYDIIKDLNAFPAVRNETKSVNLSTNYRNLGNKHFKDANMYIAWQHYNLSLLYAPLNSEDYSLALSNRSAVLFNLKKITECLKDVETILAMKHPDKITEKLEKRKEQCIALSNTKNKATPIDTVFIFKDKQEQYPCASPKLEVVYTEDMGRHVIAKEDIKVGEVLVSENPYFPLLLKSQYLFGCSYCLSRTANLLPCDTCCYALYCSDECKVKAWNEYHIIECSLMSTLFVEDFTKLELLALRTVIKAQRDHKDWQSLFQTIEETDQNLNTDKHGCVQIENKWSYDSKYYASIHGLASNIDKRTASDKFQKCVRAAVFLYLLKEHTTFLNASNDEDGNKILNCVAGLLLHHEMTSPTNMHGISTTVEDNNGNFIESLNIGCGAYAFLSLLNHSCAPNVVRFNKLGTGTMALFALRPIKKGQQLFDNYGPHHALEGRFERNQTLKSQYRFTCECEACVNNWPTYLGLQSAHLPQQIKKLKSRLLSDHTIESLQKGDRKVAYKLFKPLCQLAEDLEPFGPCKELADSQESMKQCLGILHGVLPYEFSQLSA